MALQRSHKFIKAGWAAKNTGKGLTVKGELYPLLQTRIVDITADVLIDWQKQETQARPTKSRQGYELFRALWRWCAQEKAYKSMIDVSIVEIKGLRKKIPTRESKKFDVLQRSLISTIPRRNEWVFSTAHLQLMAS